MKNWKKWVKGALAPVCTILVIMLIYPLIWAVFCFPGLHLVTNGTSTLNQSGICYIYQPQEDTFQQSDYRIKATLARPLDYFGYLFRWQPYFWGDFQIDAYPQGDGKAEIQALQRNNMLCMDYRRSGSTVGYRLLYHINVDHGDVFAVLITPEGAQEPLIAICGAASQEEARDYLENPPLSLDPSSQRDLLQSDRTQVSHGW